MGNKTPKLSGRIIMTLLLAILTALPLGLTACGIMAQNPLRDEVDRKFQSIKQYDAEAIEALIKDIGAGIDFDSYGISRDEFARAWLSDFSYSIDNVSQDGNDAIVTVTVTCKPMGEILSASQRAIVEFTKSDAAAGMSSDEINRQAGQILLSTVATIPATTTSADFPYVSDGSTWEPGPGFNTELKKAFN